MAPPTPVLFVPECYADTALTLTWLRDNEDVQERPLDYVNHAQGIGNVGNIMSDQAKLYGTSRCVIGIVDLDRKFYQQPYLGRFKLMSGSMERNYHAHERHSHALLQHPTNTSQYLIVINHACDIWLWNRVAELGMNPSVYGLPETFTVFKDQCKKLAAANDPRLNALLDSIATARRPAYAVLADFAAYALELNSPF